MTTFHVTSHVLPAGVQGAGTPALPRHPEPQPVRVRAEKRVSSDGGEPQPPGEGGERPVEQPPHRHG